MNNLYSLKAEIKKSGDAIYFSQLDIFRLFIRALRRSSLPILYTKGFNPHPKINMGEALKLGKEGILNIIFYFEALVSPEEFKEKFSSQIPQGLEIISVAFQNNPSGNN